jgi:hypothetical protein
MAMIALSFVPAHRKARGQPQKNIALKGIPR